MTALRVSQAQYAKMFAPGAEQGGCAAIPRPGRFPRASIADRSVDGITFDSKREMVRWGFLVLLQRTGKIRDLERQPKFPVAIGGKHFCTYSADFRYFDVEKNRIVVEDCKSTGTAKDTAYRLRKRAAELVYRMTVVEVFS